MPTLLPPYSCIIIEDEELPRLSLQTKIETYHPDLRIVDLCEDADSALESLLRHKPDIVFLDIQLPGKDSMWLLEQLERSTRLPQIIFTTAFTDPQYLLKAIKFSATDYLNKPVNIVELAQAVEKAKKEIEKERRAKDLTGSGKPVWEKNCSFRTLNSQLILSEEEILYIRADGNYSQAKLFDGKEVLIFERLGEIEKRLNNPCCIRVGRSLIVNRRYIRKLNAKDCSCTLVTPYGSHKVTLPREGYEKLRSLF